MADSDIRDCSNERSDVLEPPNNTLSIKKANTVITDNRDSSDVVCAAKHATKPTTDCKSDGDHQETGTNGSAVKESQHLGNRNSDMNSSTSDSDDEHKAVKVYDSDGYSMNLRVLNVDGVKYATLNFTVEGIKGIPDFPLRDDDILLCSFPKSGSHWMWEILRMLVSGQLIYDEAQKDHQMMELTPPEIIKAQLSPRILNNHSTFDHQPKDMLKKKVKVVFIYRNLKDVATSFYHHHRGTPEYGYEGDCTNFVHRMVDGLTNCGSPFPYLKNWSQRITEHPEFPIFECCYEDLKENPLPILRQLSQYLGYDHTDEFLLQVNEVASFDQMRVRKGGSSSSSKLADGTPLMYRKGKVGDWRNHFTVALNEWFDSVIATELKDSRFKFRYDL